MLDLIGYERTGFLVFLNLAMFALAFLLLQPALVPHNGSKQQGYLLGWVMIMLFSIFAFWGNDFFHMAISYSYIASGGFTHMEAIYVWIMQNVCHDYMSFRLLIWGCSLLLFHLSIKASGVNKYTAWAVFVPISLLWESYSRATLSMAFMFYAYSLWNYKGKRSFIRKLFAIPILLASFYFHKSSMFGIAIIVAASILRMEKKYSIYMLLLLIPALYFGLQYFFEDFMQQEGARGGDLWEGSVYSGQSYMEREVEARSFSNTLIQYLERSVYYLTAYIGVLCLCHGHMKEMSFEQKAFIRLQLFFVLVSSMFLIDFGFNATIITERFFRFNFFPTTIVVAYYIQNRIYPYLTKWVLCLGVLMTSYELLYCLFLHIE